MAQTKLIHLQWLLLFFHFLSLYLSLLHFLKRLFFFFAFQSVSMDSFNSSLSEFRQFARVLVHLFSVIIGMDGWGAWWKRSHETAITGRTEVWVRRHFSELWQETLRTLQTSRNFISCWMAYVHRWVENIEVNTGWWIKNTWGLLPEWTTRPLVAISPILGNRFP